MNKTVGNRIKKLRTKRKMTLKELSFLSDLSVGFLSQLERGMSSVAIDDLEKLSRIFDVDMSFFFTHATNEKSYVMKSYERRVSPIARGNSIQYYLSKVIEDKQLLPRLIELLPGHKSSALEREHEHEGEEFIYVLEGILTLIVDGIKTDLYPEYTAHYLTSSPHNWVNSTNKTVKFITVNTPNFLVDADGEVFYKNPDKKIEK
ncbi:MAG: XRE family transcriptional regulator [Psychrilyobacter sp.]|uniref:helix-turn-helix domain-containing protein n=1 Tax=Psychrilyobacter sp. TaxID=2586924 RepID=UPI003C710E54